MGTTKYVTLPGGSIAYDDTGGTEPLVVLVHGLGDRRGAYRFLAPLLARAGYRVITTDMRAHGESSSSWNDYTQTAVGLDLVALIRELNAGPAVLVGHSYSAGSVIWTAAHAPLMVAGIASMAGFIRDKPVGLMARSASMLMARSASAWSLHYNYAHRTTKPADLPAWRKGLVEMLGEPSRKKAFATMVLGSTREGERWAPAVNCPVLVIMGKKDPDFRDPTNEAALQGRLLSAEVVLIDGAGHYPHSEFPDRVAAALLPFLQMTLSTQPDAYQSPRKSPL